MKRIFILLLALLPLVGFAQSAKSLLEKFSAQMQATKTAAITFEYVYESKADNAHQAEAGRLLLKDNMYRLERGDNTVYFNGKLRWSYLKSANEVTITLPNPLEDGMFANPAALFSFDEKDYKYKLKGEKSLNGKPVIEIDLFPKDEQAGYTNINLRMDKNTLHPASIMYFDRSGGSVYITVKKFDTSVTPTPADFTFDPKNHPQVEVVDMR